MASVTDTFDRADSATALGTTSDGTLTWVAAVGTFGITSNKAYCANSAGSVALAHLDVGSADIDYTLTWSTFDANATGQLFRYSSTSEYWFVINDGSTWKLNLRTGGSNFTDANTYAAAAANGDVVRIVANGSGAGAIKVYVNGTLRITSSGNESFNATNTKHGLYANFNTASRWDGLTITDLNAVAAVSDPARQSLPACLLAI